MEINIYLSIKIDTIIIKNIIKIKKHNYLLNYNSIDHLLR